MKKLFNIIGAFALFATMCLTSCGDNTDFSSPHVLTDDEIAEIKRQDSIKQAELNRINADLVLEYTVEDYASASNWINKSLEIDLNAIGQVFGLTAQQVKDGINQESGAPEITGFAILASNHRDVSTASTTNGTWGHWWTTEGDLCNKYNDDNSALFCEWNGDTFTVGQYPGHLTEGQEVTVIEGLKYGDKRVAVKITFKCIAREEVKATIVDTKELKAEFAASADSYDGTTVEFDINDVMSKLGVSSPKDITVIGFDANGGYVQEFTANAGFWYDKAGIPCAYGDDAVAFMEYWGNQDEAEESDQKVLSIGQFPGHLQAGDTFTLPIGFLANNKIVKMVVTVTVTEAAATPAE